MPCKYLPPPPSVLLIPHYSGPVYFWLLPLQCGPACSAATASSKGTLSSPHSLTLPPLFRLSPQVGSGLFGRNSQHLLQAAEADGTLSSFISPGAADSAAAATAANPEGGGVGVGGGEAAPPYPPPPAMGTPSFIRAAVAYSAKQGLEIDHTHTSAATVQPPGRASRWLHAMGPRARRVLIRVT